MRGSQGAHEMNVLVVDDNEANLLFAAEVLREQGWNVQEASGGFDAMMQLDVEDFDLIVADIRMPHLSGEKLLEWVSCDSRFANTHVIACTAHAQPEEAQALLRAGFDRVLLKPVNSADLVKACQSCKSRPPRHSVQIPA